MQTAEQKTNETKVIHIRIPPTLVALLEEEVRSSAHLSMSDYVRDLIRSELRRRGRI